MTSFFLDERIVIPFLSTAAASLTVFFIEKIHRGDSERKKKLYALGYMAALVRRFLQSSLILRRNTILPHIAATKRIMEGDEELRRQMFLADEFDILAGDSPRFESLPEEHRVLIGYGDIDLLQSFEYILSHNQSDRSERSLNDYVKRCLKSELDFLKKGPEERVECLSTYWDYLAKVDHVHERNIAFVLQIFLPKVREYANRFEFLLHSKRNVLAQIRMAEVLASDFQDVVPAPDFVVKLSQGGIQNLVKEDVENGTGSTGAVFNSEKDS
jgi:hypothetical protein